mmetsp:Transcript_40428/g.72640  ORF Transcript_40428/g.72640 Transcript_40428/m.72640 type:complete len:323 (-) Transcript_40428:178-1146(-)
MRCTLGTAICLSVAIVLADEPGQVLDDAPGMQTQLLDFDPFQVFKPLTEFKEDLIVVLHPSRALGRTPLMAALNKFAVDPETRLSRKRGLVVSHCRQCYWFEQVLRRWHVDESRLPVAVLFPHSHEETEEGRFLLDMNQWSTAEEFQTGLDSFLQRYDAGKEHHFVHSQPIPSEDEQDDFVRELVGDSFQSEVLERLALNISTLVLFYRPWCGWCRQVHPVFKAIARKLGAKNTLLRVAKMDVDQNEVIPEVHVNVHSVPAIYLVTPEHKFEPLFFTDGSHRTVERILSWCREHVVGLGALLDSNQTQSTGETGGLGGLDDL